MVRLKRKKPEKRRTRKYYTRRNPLFDTETGGPFPRLGSLGYFATVYYEKAALQMLKTNMMMSWTASVPLPKPTGILVSPSFTNQYYYVKKS